MTIYVYITSSISSLTIIEKRGNGLLKAMEQTSAFPNQQPQQKVSSNSVHIKISDEELQGECFKLAFILSILSCCCCWCIGVPAIYLAKKAQDNFKYGFGERSNVLLTYSYILSALGIYMGMVLLGIRIINEYDYE
ncbi:hypothetical protein HELRODRAFT_159155 [Helobdella robusta]|uniref:Uncharacterized protein n=1 Tax=Helobdella robusta TaxID=6412 RepID=T1ENN9_HELRO|nr:hypothetical protein HELRODRAFT_159155 [Helobdella robusta]ESO12594.1 hypothetical protein HELRODRAFT_159155 [Helobdella robusta]